MFRVRPALTSPMNSGCAKSPMVPRVGNAVGAIGRGFVGCTYVSFQYKTVGFLGRPTIEPWRLSVVAHLLQALVVASPNESLLRETFSDGIGVVVAGD